MRRAMVVRGARFGAVLGAGVAAVVGAFVVVPGMVFEQSVASLAADAVVLAAIVAVGLVVGLLHGLVLGMIAATVWAAVRPRMKVVLALDAVTVVTAITVMASYVGIAGVGASSIGLLMGVGAGVAARLEVRQLMVERDHAYVVPGYQVRGRIYVETQIDAPLERVWALTQDPVRHARWDLRFGQIEPQASEEGVRRFTYSTFGVSGTGVHVGDRWRESGGATSSLRFASPHVLSPIAEGAGYWRYEPEGGTLRFLTGYDYRPRYRRIDQIFRPLMGWATAWSFDRLRLWAERDQSPGRSLALALVDVVMRAAVVVLAGAAGDALTALAAAFVVWWIPAPAWVPSARRCLRQPPDDRSATAPHDLATLEKA